MNRRFRVEGGRVCAPERLKEPAGRVGSAGFFASTAAPAGVTSGVDMKAVVFHGVGAVTV